MRIRTDGKKSHRKAIIEGLAADLDENRTDALVDAGEHARASANSQDDRRMGSRWTNVDLEEREVTNLSKKQEWGRPLSSEPHHEALRQLYIRFH